MRGFIDEIRAAISGLARAPSFTALAVGVLGLGLAAVIFMYGVALSTRAFLKASSTVVCGAHSISTS
jgi:hypothetical protein